MIRQIGMIYSPLSIFNDDLNKAVIYLNHPTFLPDALFKRLWKNAYPIAFVDGLANHVYKNINYRNDYFPHFLTGDFDSIHPEVLEFYRSRSVSVVETPDQDETDFTKCVRVIVNSIRKNNTEVSVLVAAQMSGGRFDHEIGVIKTMYETKKFTSIPLFLVSECSVTFLLDEGEHTIHANTGYEAHSVGLIPVGQPCQVTTTGLKWNLDNSILSFDDIVSTSNRLSSEIVNVKCNQRLLFTMEYKSNILN
ncbi:thiamine pyrophosphokinase 1 [Schistosoma japonicum]|uniref:Thiamine pyrophosphokinase 1 n=2 Tax=Schistosoma japonicum TaxID=6182 RepID=A0A4Z2D839_SCHJA|nr:thiamine pyrophosphokinase 1 [Schistosoma japonicum]